VLALLGAATGVAPVLLGLAVVLVAAKVGQEIAARLRQSPVVGEILAGVVLGNLTLFGLADPAFLRSDTFEVLAEIGILLLLFEIGVESTVGQMLRTGGPALRVAAIGVAAPFALGWGASHLAMPEASPYMHLFVGAILCATSVGITARVLADIGRTKTPEARLILGAAVIDDVLGLILLAVMSGLVVSAAAGVALDAWTVARIVLGAVLFLAVSIPIGMWVVPRLFAAAARLRAHGVLLAASLALCFTYAWLGTLVGLAPIVGAFAAGLVLEERHLEGLAEKERLSLEQMLKPLTALLLPVFFVLIGMKVDLRLFADARVLGLALLLLAAAVIGKMACGLGAGSRVDRWTVGVGMVPRGEVGFIFAGIGTTLMLNEEPVVPPLVFSAVVLVVILTTLGVPPVLTWHCRRACRRPPANVREPACSGDSDRPVVGAFASGEAPPDRGRSGSV
jgi:Kef-type K+ transport system membrane component KefB